VNETGLRVALICAVLSAVVYEFLTMIYAAIRSFYRFASRKKVDFGDNEIELANKNNNSNNNNRLISDNDEIHLLQTQNKDLMKQLEEEKKLLENERKQVIELKKLLSLEDKKIKDKYHISNTIIENKFDY
jgi:hypothetical protein